MKYRFLMITFLASFFVEAQEIIPITKAEVLNRILENNGSIKISEQNVYAAKGDYSQSNAVILPNISISHTGIVTTNPLMAFGSKLNQEILTQNDFNPALLNNPSQTQNYTTTIAIQQPLINLDGIYQRKAAKTKLIATSEQAKRTKEHISFEADKAYMKLQLSYKVLETLEVIKRAVLENMRLAENKFKQGYLQKADVLAIQIRVSEIENQLQYAKSAIINASNYVSYLMNSSRDVVLKPTDNLMVLPIDITNEDVSKERSDIKAMLLASKAHQTLYMANKMTFLPTLNAFGSYDLYDDKLFAGNAGGYLVGVQLSWTILEGNKRFGKVQKSKANYQKSKLEYQQYVSKSDLEYQQAKRALLDAKNNINLSELALRQSKESLRIRTNRFKQGLERTTDLLLSEKQYAEKQLQYYQTVFNYNYAQSYLQFLTKG